MYGLLGKTLGHSFSKQIHQALSPEITYELLETKSLKDFIRTIPFKGVNVTLPYKHEILDLLDYIDPTAKAIGAVNTIVLKDNKLCGYNTDYLALKEIIDNTYPSNKETVITILGNGATKGTLMYTLKLLGYQKIHVCARNPKANEHPLTAIPKESEIIINATPVGMYPSNDSHFDIDLNEFPNMKLIHDLVYNPFYTTFIQQAKSHGIKALSGLKMLYLQAYYAQKLFGLSPKKNIDALIEQFKKETLNIVFIGLPFSGKSHYGRLLAKSIQRPFVDIDNEIENTTNLSIDSIFTIKGESYFRMIEGQIVQKKAKLHRQIIAPGGGVILNEALMIALKQNSFIIYLDMDDALLERINIKGRPLIKSKTDWMLLKENRESLYKHYADAVIRKDTFDEAVILKRIEATIDAYFNN